jgi:hypothetical protein
MHVEVCSCMYLMCYFDIFLHGDYSRIPVFFCCDNSCLVRLLENYPGTESFIGKDGLIFISYILKKMSRIYCFCIFLSTALQCFSLFIFFHMSVTFRYPHTLISVYQILRIYVAIIDSTEHMSHTTIRAKNRPQCFSEVFFNE